MFLMPVSYSMILSKITEMSDVGRYVLVPACHFQRWWDFPTLMLHPRGASETFVESENFILGEIHDLLS